MEHFPTSGRQLVSKSMHRFGIILAWIGVSLSIGEAAMAQDGDASRGARLFEKRCAGCHINQGVGGRGPNLTDIVGGRPGAVGFDYSSSIWLIHSWRWDVTRLDRFLQNPRAVDRRATMASRVRDRKDRADIIAYLKTLRSPPGAPTFR
jgi:cytochrome c2